MGGEQKGAAVKACTWQPPARRQVGGRAGGEQGERAARLQASLEGPQGQGEVEGGGRLLLVEIRGMGGYEAPCCRTWGTAA